MKKSCVIYDSWADQIINLPPEMAGEYAKAILLYAIYGEESDIENPAIKAMLVPVKKKIDVDNGKYQEKVERMKNNSTRNRDDIDTKSERNQDDIDTKSTRNRDEIVSDTDTVTVTDTDKDKKKSIEKKHPSVDEVRAYCEERHNNVDPETFVDFYSSKGWKVGNQPMKDWKACVRTWEKRDGPIKTKVHNFNERKIDYSELQNMVGGKL